MSEIDILKRIEALENKVAELENTLNTIGMMEKSERITEYLQNRRRNQSLVSLVNSMSDEEIVISHQEAENEKRMAEEQKRLEQKIKEAIDNDKNNSSYQKDESENSFSYIFNPMENGLTITSYNGFNTDTLVIPSSIKELEVTAIGEAAFKNNDFKRIVIPNSVTSIRKDAFKGCINLSVVELGQKVYSLEDHAFAGCESLKSIKFPSSLCNLGKGCFSQSGIEKVIIPPTIKTIPFQCFSLCYSLKEVVISEGVNLIDSYAFNGCNKLTALIIPKSMKHISPCLFGDLHIPKCDLVFLGMETQWRTDIIGIDHFPYTEKLIVFCASGSLILQSSRQNGCEVHSLSEYFNK